MKLIDYVKGRGSQRSLAQKLSITPVLISQWANELRPVPPERCVEIEVATKGEVSRKDLRPNDWQKIWPELAAPKSRRATDPTPEPGRAGRQPASPHNILDTVPEGAVVVPTGEPHGQ
jgi:DNA-binding transcriptional regulator YdaS (Cro superfamily)